MQIREQRLDRRKQPASPFHVQRLMGRRRQVRREEGVHSPLQHVDVFQPQVFKIALLIMIFCALDAHNTPAIAQ